MSRQRGDALQVRPLASGVRVSTSHSGARPAEIVAEYLHLLMTTDTVGTPFEGNRFLDRPDVGHGRIAQVDIWNGSAERLLKRAGWAAA